MCACVYFSFLHSHVEYLTSTITWGYTFYHICVYGWFQSSQTVYISKHVSLKRMFYFSFSVFFFLLCLRLYLVSMHVGILSDETVFSFVATYVWHCCPFGINTVLRIFCVELCFRVSKKKKLFIFCERNKIQFICVFTLIPHCSSALLMLMKIDA